jgi:hypothetical protein
MEAGKFEPIFVKLNEVYTPYPANLIYHQYLKWNNYVLQKDQLVYGCTFYLESKSNCFVSFLIHQGEIRKKTYTL